MVTIMSYGARLKEILKEKNMSVKELSKKANINQSYIQ
jgi:transcriptional regulator with XRE-family HTH domain